MSMFIGEALVGEGNEVAHIDLLIGDKDGPVGVAFANALSDQKAGHSNLLAVLEPNLAVKPATVMITKVTIKGARQAVQVFGPAQKGGADAVAETGRPVTCVMGTHRQYIRHRRAKLCRKAGNARPFISGSRHHKRTPITTPTTAIA